MSSAIKLNFINHSNDHNNSSVVIFQKNVSTNFDEIAVAWKVIENCGQGWHHPFVFPMEFQAGASDSWGNHTPPLDAQMGQQFQVVRGESGDQFELSGESTSPTEVEIKNSLPQGSINANIFKDGKLLAVKSAVSPEQKAVFSFKPTIFMGVVSQVQEGQIMNSAIISSINTEIGLLGISSADIVMTGGGVGPNASPFQFTLENIVYA